MKSFHFVCSCSVILALASCKENNTRPIDEAPDSNSTLIDEDNGAIPNTGTSSSSTATYTDAVDGTVNEIDSTTASGRSNPDMTTMYSELEMSDEQIKNYEAAQGLHQEIVEMNKDVSKTLMKKRNQDMKSILSPSQYTKYEDMAKYYFKVGDSATTNNE